MDLNQLLFWTVCLSCITFVFRAKSSPQSRGWAGIAVAILGVTLLSIYLFPQWAGFIGGSLWVVFLLLPLLGFAHVNQLISQERYREARRWTVVLRWLHPTDGWFEQPQILRALERGQQGQVTPTFQHLHPRLIHNTKVLQLRLEARWPELLQWIETHVTDQELRQNPPLMTDYLRALGEMGDLNRLIFGLQQYQGDLQRGGVMPLNLARLLVLAFCGQTDGVNLLLQQGHYAQETKAFWRLTAQGAAQPSPQIALSLQTLQQQQKAGGLRQAIAWRLAHPPVQPEACLTPAAWQALQLLQTEVKQVIRYGQGLTLIPSRTPWITYGFIALNVAYFALQIHAGGSQDPATLDRLGALIPMAVRLGEWWRLLAANFLHYGWLHLGINLLGLYLLGPWVEFNLGRWRYFWLYWGSGVGSMLVYTALAFVTGDEQVRLVGASAAIMGLLGAIVAILLRGWLREGSAIAAQRLQVFLGIIVLQLTVDFFIPEVSGLAHGLGLIWGFTLGSLLLMRSQD